MGVFQYSQNDIYLQFLYFGFVVHTLFSCNILQFLYKTTVYFS